MAVKGENMKLIIFFALFFWILKKMFDLNPMKTKEQLRKEVKKETKVEILPKVDITETYKTSKETFKTSVMYNNDICEWLDEIMRLQPKKEYTSYLLNEVYFYSDGDIAPIYESFDLKAICDGRNVEVYYEGEWKHLGIVGPAEQLEYYLQRDPEMWVNVSERFGRECIPVSDTRVKLGKRVHEYDYELELWVKPTKDYEILEENSEN